jgi:hypothetical protein
LAAVTLGLCLVAPTVALADKPVGPTVNNSPITYITDLEGTGTFGPESVGLGTIGSPGLWDYYCFFGEANDVISLEGHRLTNEMDPAFSLFLGVTRDSDGLSAGGSSQPGMTFLAFRDDEIAPPHGVGGNFADPQLLNFALPATGRYTVGIYDFIGQGPNPTYELHPTNFPASLRSRLTTIRNNLAGLVLTGNQANLRRNNAVSFLDRSRAATNFDRCALFGTDSDGAIGIREMRAAFNYIRTPNAELAAAGAGVMSDLYALAERMVDTRFGEVSPRPENAGTSALSQAAQHIANAADNAGTDQGFVQLIKAWDVMRSLAPQFPST